MTNFLIDNKQVEKYLPFEEARAYVIGRKFKNQKEYHEWWKSEGKSQNIPYNPDKIYKNKGWNGWGDWLGTGTIASKNKGFLTFEEARDYVRKLGLKNAKEYHEWCKSDNRPQNIPSNPDRTFNNEGWNGWGDWLGTGTIASKNKGFLTFEEARNYVRTLGFKGKKEYYKWCKSENRPQNIPSNPASTYNNEGWNGWGDWLGTGTIAPKNIVYLPFEEARERVRKLGLKNVKEYHGWCKSEGKSQNIPHNPPRTYKNKGWNGWGDWLRTGTIASFNIVYLPFEEARERVRKLGLKNQKEYREWSKSDDRPQNIPSAPQRTYEKEFNSWPDWLGLKKVNRWTQNTLVAFFKETILPIIDTLDSATLQLIIIHSGCNNAIKQLAKDHPLRKLLDAKYNDDFEKVKQATIETQNYKATDDIIEEDYEDFEDNDELATQQTFENTTENDFRNLKVQDIIKEIKSLENSIGINLADEDLAEFLQSNQLHKLWTVIYNSSNPEDEIQIIINA